MREGLALKNLEDEVNRIIKSAPKEEQKSVALGFQNLTYMMNLDLGEYLGKQNGKYSNVDYTHRVKQKLLDRITRYAERRGRHHFNRTPEFRVFGRKDFVKNRERYVSCYKTLCTNQILEQF